MKAIIFSLCLAGMGLFLLVRCVPSSSEKISENRQRPFDNDWKFIKDSLTEAEDPAFDDSGWRTLDLPHDWSIEDLPGAEPGNSQLPGMEVPTR